MQVRGQLLIKRWGRDRQRERWGHNEYSKAKNKFGNCILYMQNFLEWHLGFGWVLVVISGHRKDCPTWMVVWSVYVFPCCFCDLCRPWISKGWVPAVRLGSWCLRGIGTPEEREPGISPERCVGHTLLSAEMRLWDRQLNFITVPLMRCCLIFWKPEYSLSTG